MYVETKLDIFHETSELFFLTLFVAREPDTFEEMWAGFSTVFVPTKLETFDETLGKLPAVFVATKRGHY